MNEDDELLDSLHETEADRLRARLRALKEAMGPLGSAASGEEPLFPPDLAAVAEEE